MESIDFSNQFMQLYEKEKAKLPYHINLLDIVGASEPKHSRILLQLFRYTSPDGEYTLLKSFFRHIAEKHKTQWDIDIESPVISAERENIDLWVRETLKYSVIIENKIHNAGDQPNQLARYIEKSLYVKFDLEQIYVIYLTRDGSKQPSENTWLTEDEHDYSDEFSERYLNISYRHDILPWLENELVKCADKDVFLQQVLGQYIDHLYGLFNLRKSEKSMNEALQNIIRKNLCMKDDTPRENLAALQRKREDLNLIINQISLMEIEERQKSIPLYIQKWAEHIKVDFQQVPEFYGYNTVYIKGEKNGETFEIQITMEPGNGATYCGVSNGAPEITKWLKTLDIQGEYDDPDMNVLIYSDPETIYNRFKELAIKILY